MLRITSLTATLAALLLLTGCTSSDSGARGNGPSDAPSVVGCGECTAELVDVRAEIEALPDVKELVTLEIYADTPTNGAGVQVELRSTTTGDPAVMDEVGRIIWQSRLTPVDEVFVAVEDAAGELVRGSSPYDFNDHGRPYDAYVGQWGPRPVGE